MRQTGCMVWKRYELCLHQSCGRDGCTVNCATSDTCTGGEYVVFVLDLCGVVEVTLMGFKVDGDLKFG